MNAYREYSDAEFLIDLNNDAPSERPEPKISNYIEGRRIMPSNTPFPGPYENWRTQYAVEIMNCMSPWSPIQYVDVMAAAQTVKSVTVENVVGYYMGAMPSPITYVSGTDDLLRKWGPKRLEPLIDSLGIRHKMVAQIENEKSRMSGDNIKQKLFTGGFLEMASAQSPSSLRADTVKILILEEVDSAPQMLTTGEGRWDEVVEARTKAFGNRRKILAVSTPTLIGQSIIYERFLLGDQCEYFVPCPLCGKFQILDESRLRADKKGGHVQFMYMLCDFCDDAIMENQKNFMIRGGRWESQTRAEKYRRSFHLNSLYSASGMYSWFDYYVSMERAEKDPKKQRPHVNLQKGLPFRETGTRPKVHKILENQGNYKSGDIPTGVLFLTMFVDVQRGSEKDASNPARLEYEICGHGVGFRTWSIAYGRFEGEIDDPYSGAWEKMQEWAVDGGLEYHNKDGLVFPVQLTLIDSGDGVYADVVYTFTQRWDKCYPSKGFSALKRRAKEKKDLNIDEAEPTNFKRYRAQKVSESITLFEISTNYYKKHIYRNLRIERVEGQKQKPGFCDFPIDYKERYFQMLTAEELLEDGSFDAGGRRNEALDCRVGNMCGGDVYLDSLVTDLKAKYKANGVDVAGLAAINHRFVLQALCKNIGIDFE